MILFTVVRWLPWPQEESPDDLMTTIASCPQNQIISPSAACRASRCGRAIHFLINSVPAEAGSMRLQTWTPPPRGGSLEIMAGTMTTVRRDEVNRRIE